MARGGRYDVAGVAMLVLMRWGEQPLGAVGPGESDLSADRLTFEEIRVAHDAAVSCAEE
jgi:hypothetical protein